MTNDTSFTVGAKIGEYRIERVLPLENLQGQYVELLHERLGSRHIHVACADENNAFNVMFPTVPQDSTGVAHILEHVVLAGSEKYPVRDPFFSMIPRSLSTFMNAMTGQDSTSYPFSTRNRTDYYNLLEVYLDATFFPRITRETFLQEGWRFEFEDGDDPSTTLKYKGVVFNEMKGGMATPVYVLYYRGIGPALFPDLTYRFNSGGDPLHIPDLTHEQLQAFHARHYHPSNAYFYTYGNMPLEPRLAAIEKHVMSRFQPLEIDTRIPNQPNFTAPVTLEVPYPLSKSEPLEAQSQVLVAWKTGFVGDTLERLSLDVLSSVVLSNAASPLRKALVESGLGTALADMNGLIPSYREMVFAAGLKGVRTENVEKVEALVLETLRDLVRDGVPDEMVDAAVHQIEIDSREVSNAGTPYALKVAFTLEGAYQHGGDPYNALRFDADLERLAEARGKGHYFEGLIEKFLLNNPHRARIVLRPDQDMTERAEADEIKLLETIKANLSPEDVSRIVADAKTLSTLQDAPQDLSVLPTLALSDVPMNFEDVPHKIETIHSAKVGLFPQPTNGLVYVDVQVDFSSLPERLKDLLPVFAYVAPKMGAGPSTYLEMASRIEAFTGGVGMGAGLRGSPDNREDFTQSFTVSGKALNRNVAAFFEILTDLMTDLKFDRAHLKNLLGQYRASLESRVIGVGHLFARKLAEAQLSKAGALKERLEGITQIGIAKKLAALDDDGLSSLIADLETIQKALFRNANLRACLTAEETQLERVTSELSALFGKLPSGTSTVSASTGEPWAVHPQARTTAVPVAYDALVIPTVPYTHPDAPVLMALAEYIRSRYTHPEVREKGGAYGGFATTDRENGSFAMISYRDPHIVRTFGVFRDAARFVLDKPIDDEAAKEAVLSACSDVDPLSSPDSKGRSRFFNDLAGFTLDKRIAFKTRLLQVTADDLRRVAQTYLTRDGAMAVISNDEKIAQANLEMGDVFEVAAI
jgi:presequence protease